MSEIKHATTRYKILDECFRTTYKKYTIDDLVQVCNAKLIEFGLDSEVKKRTIQYDIAFMASDKGWQIELDETLKEGKKRFYRYKNTHFSIYNTPLRPDEVVQLKSTLDLLKKIEGLPLMDWMYEILPKLSKQNYTTKDSFISLDHNIDLMGYDYLKELFFAIENKTVLQIEYQPFDKDEPYSLTFHPYFLKEYNNRWFVLGLNPYTNKSNYILAFDRIKSMKPTNLHYIDNNSIDFKDYFEDMIGVSKPENAVCQKIILHISGKTAHYVATKTWHSTQNHQWISENLLEVKLDIVINIELKKLILAHGKYIKVIAPESLIDDIKQEIREMDKMYENKDTD